MMKTISANDVCDCGHYRINHDKSGCLIVVEQEGGCDCRGFHKFG